MHNKNRFFYVSMLMPPFLSQKNIKLLPFHRNYQKMVAVLFQIGNLQHAHMDQLTSYTM